MAELTIQTREDGNANIIELNGYLDAHTAPQLEDVFNKLIEEKKFNVVVNFKDLQYISSAGLGVFMAYVETMRENDGDIKFANLSESVYNIFDLLGFPMLYEFYKDEKEALAKYNEQG